MEYGGIYAEDQATGTATNIVTGIGNAAWTKVMAFNKVAPANGVAANAGIDELEISGEGVYYAFCHLSIFGTLDNEMEFVILNNDLATDIKADIFLGHTGSTSPYALTLGGLLEVDAGNRIALGVQVASGSGQEITLHQGHLGVYRVS